MTEIFKYIKAAQFFPKYAPAVRDWRKKLTGKNGRGNPVAFSEADVKAVWVGLRDMMRDFNNKK